MRKEPSETTSTPQNSLAILYQDTDLLIIDKPADLLSVPGRGPDKQDCVINRLLVDFPQALIVHRLDMATSGLLVIALNKQAQAAMGERFAKREVEKCYIAVVDGQPADPIAHIDLPLICDWENRPKQKVDYEHGKSAQTDMRCIHIDTKNDCSRVELRPITGRSHQLRVHMQAMGHPILGDYFYASEAIQAKSSRLLLHAQHLKFLHPITQAPIDIQSVPPF